MIVIFASAFRVAEVAKSSLLAYTVHLYTVQVDDNLPHLADKFYRDPLAWPAVFLATNHLATSDPRVTPLDSPYLLKPGQLLALPEAAQLAPLLAEYAAGHPQPVPYPRLQPVGAAWLAGFSAYVEQARQHFGIPGVALALVRNNQIVLAQGFGVRELGRPEPVTPQTLFGIGSTTKSMTSLLLATLVDDGRLTWDQPVVEIWPDFSLSDPAVTPQIRLRHLLNMSSGLPRADLVWSGSGMTAEEVMVSLARLPLAAPPGQQFQYNNQAVATAGYVGALAAGAEYGQLGPAYAGLLQRRVFEPIGMSSASFSVEAVQASPNHATPHDFTLFGQVVPTYYHTDPGIAPAGGVNASVLDLARFVLTELNQGVAPDGTRVVSAENLTETWRPQIKAYGDTSYGMGWFIEPYQGVEMIWHDGDVLGFKSLLAFIPEANVGLALLTNRTISVGFSSSVRYRLIEALYGLDVEAGDYYKTQWDHFIEALPGLREPLEAKPAPAEVAPYLGEYAGNWRVEQREDGAVWAVRGPYQWQLLAAGKGEFIVNNGFGITTPLEFVMDDTGVVTMTFKLSTGEVGRYQRLE